MYGSHLSIAGSMLNALDEAQKLELDAVQVFTKNQQQWKAKPLDASTIDPWRARIKDLSWETRTVSHASYLINLASPNDELYAKSIDLMEEEIRRCDQLGIPFLVHHPGAFTTSTREEGLARIAQAYQELFKRTKGTSVVSCLENTVGSGSNLGREFTELAQLRDMIVNLTKAPERVGFCIDTCHAHAGGYDLSAADKAKKVVAQLDREVGLDNVRVFHLNDSKGGMGSRRDLHAHIGEGTIGLPGFEGFLSDKRLAGIPKILETPKGVDDQGVSLDTLNLRRLWSLAKDRPISTPIPGNRPPASTAKGTPPKRKTSKTGRKEPRS